MYCKCSGTEGTWIECWIVEERYLRGLEVSTTMCLQQSRTVCYVELMCWYVYVYLVRIEIYDNVMYVVHICTHAQAYTWDIAIESLPELWYDAEVLGHIRNELIDYNAKMFGC